MEEEATERGLRIHVDDLPRPPPPSPLNARMLGLQATLSSLEGYKDALNRCALAVTTTGQNIPRGGDYAAPCKSCG